MDRHQLELEIKRIREGDDSRSTELLPAKIAKPPGHGQIHHRDELSRIANFITPTAIKRSPEWDGVHGRWIILLPLQNRFTINDPAFKLDILPPEKPTMELIDGDRFTKVKVGLIKDTAEAKLMKDGRKIVRAGTFAYIRLCPSSLRKSYDVTDSLGSVLAVRDVIFLDEFATTAQRQNRAAQALRVYHTEVESIRRAQQTQMTHWEEDRKKWELALVLRAWDDGFGSFPPYVTERSQLGDQKIDIPIEYIDKPHYQSNHYCAICLEAMPLICHVCRADIDAQQEAAKEELHQREEQTLAIAHQQNLDNAHLLNQYHEAQLVADNEDKLDLDEVMANMEAQLDESNRLNKVAANNMGFSG